jgi:hypothetical protein
MTASLDGWREFGLLLQESGVFNGWNWGYEARELGALHLIPHNGFGFALSCSIVQLQTK